MDKDRFFNLGKITRLHGYKGAMMLFLDVDDPSIYYELDGIFFEQGGTMVPWFIERFDPRGNQAVIELEGIDSEEGAIPFVDKQVWLPLELLPKLSGKQFYFHEVIEFTLTDLTFGEVGKITAITEHPTNPLFICDHHGKEVLIPMNDEQIVEVNREKQLIVTDLPEGLVEMYL